MERLETFLRTKALEADGERWISAWASTPTEDRMGDSVVPEGIVYQLPCSLLYAHRHDEPVGVITEVVVSRAGVRIKAKLTQGVARAEECWKLIKDGALAYVSVGFRSLKQTPLPGGGYRFDSWELLECSVVSCPANPEARISIGKSVAYGRVPVAYVPEVEAPKIDRAWQRSVEAKRVGETDLEAFYRKYDAAVSLLPLHQREHADLHRARDDKGVVTFTDSDSRKFATVDLRTKTVHDPNAPKPTKPEPVAKAAIKAGMTTHERELLIGTHKAVRELDTAVAGGIEVLLERIKRLEAALEEATDNGIRYRGYWRDGMKAKRGDSYTHDGSLWWCARPTDDRPTTDSVDWLVAARAGRNAR